MERENAWLTKPKEANQNFKESMSSFAYKIESYLFILYKFFVVSEIQLNYIYINFIILIIIIIKID